MRYCAYTLRPQVRIKNDLPPDYPSPTNGGISIHWHGLSQRGEPWQVPLFIWMLGRGYTTRVASGVSRRPAASLSSWLLHEVVSPLQDGVAFVHQCPIMPGKEFTYRFPITDSPGTCECCDTWLALLISDAGMPTSS
jgi:FtsP/CotA-like multicopper oxidase with cupredoxin domain